MSVARRPQRSRLVSAALIAEHLLARIPRPVWAALAALAVFLIIRTGLQSVENIPRIVFFPHTDKFLHATAYGCLAACLFRVLHASPLHRRRVPPMDWVLVILIPSLVGVIDEILQGAVQRGRSSDVYDWMADTTGAAIACTLSLVHRRLVVESGKGLRSRD